MEHDHDAEREHRYTNLTTQKCWCRSTPETHIWLFRVPLQFQAKGWAHYGRASKNLNWVWKSPHWEISLLIRLFGYISNILWWYIELSPSTSLIFSRWMAARDTPGCFSGHFNVDVNLWYVPHYVWNQGSGIGARSILMAMIKDSVCVSGGKRLF